MATRFRHVILRNLRRSLAIAAVVGTILVLINHGDHITMDLTLAPVCEHFYAKCGLSYLVPFLVSMVSGVLAAREREDEPTRGAPL
jgi:hypothetical protein